MLFFDQIVTNEDKSYIVLEEANLAAERAVFACDMARKYEELRLRELECRCVMESGGVLELMDIYEAGEEAAPAKDKGLIQKAWDAIIKALRAIKNKLFGENKPKAEELPKEIKFPKPIAVIVKAFPAAWNTAKAAFTDVKNTIKNHSGLSALFVLLTGVGVAEAIKGIKSKVSEAKDQAAGEESIPTADVISTYEAAEDAVNTMENFSNKCKEATDGVPEEDRTIIQKLQALVSEFSTTIKTKIDAVKAKVGIKSKDKKDGQTTDQKDDQNVDGQNQDGKNGGQNTDGQNDENAQPDGKKSKLKLKQDNQDDQNTDGKNTNGNNNTQDGNNQDGKNGGQKSDAELTGNPDLKDPDEQSNVESFRNKAKSRLLSALKDKGVKKPNDIVKPLRDLSSIDAIKSEAVAIANKYGVNVVLESADDIHFEGEEFYLEEVELDMFLGLI